MPSRDAAGRSRKSSQGSEIGEKPPEVFGFNANGSPFYIRQPAAGGPPLPPKMTAAELKERRKSAASRLQARVRGNQQRLRTYAMYEQRDDVRESAMLYDLLIDDVRRAVAERRAAVLTIERCQRGHHGRALAHEMEEWWATQRREAEAFAELQEELRKAREVEHARRVQAQMVIGARVRGRMGRRSTIRCVTSGRRSGAWAACLKIRRGRSCGRRRRCDGGRRGAPPRAARGGADRKHARGRRADHRRAQRSGRRAEAGGGAAGECARPPATRRRRAAAGLVAQHAAALMIERARGKHDRQTASALRSEREQRKQAAGTIERCGGGVRRRRCGGTRRS